MKRIEKINTNEYFAHIWSPTSYVNDDVYNAMKDCNLWNGLTFYEKRSHYVDLWAFATDCNNTEIINFYINELDVIKKFILYLHDKARFLFFPKSDTLSLKIYNEKELIPFFKKDKKKYHLDFFKTDKFYFNSNNSSKNVKMKMDTSKSRSLMK